MTTAARPTALPVEAESIPAELRDRPQWVVWRYEDRAGKRTKVPYQPSELRRRASATDPATWGTFEAALAAYRSGRGDGIGFVFTAEDSYVGIDYDKGRDRTTGALSADAGAIVELMHSYTEVSPSGTGLHIIVTGTLPPGGNRKGSLEMYSEKRFFCMTGARLHKDRPIMPRQRELDLLHRKTFGTRAPVEEGWRPAEPRADLDDQALLEKMFTAKNGDKARRLYEGDWQGAGYGSQSEADLAFCTMVAFWTGRDPGRMSRIFQGSGLMRGKFDREDYRERTITKAIASCREVYEPGWNGRPDGSSSSTRSSTTSSPSSRWPDPLGAAAYHGLAGDFVRRLGPHTEADPAALLMQFLVMVGNLVGRGPHVRVEADRHPANLFGALVGATAKGRKGVSQGHARRPFQAVDETWARDRVQGGLSSGEGLIWAVRDPIEQQQAVKEKGRVVDYEMVVTDPGVEDKRLLVFEPELASTLRVMGRDGNTLSAIVRQAWDSGTLRVLTKTFPARATDAHISILGHITKGELLRYLDATEKGNGFANRFLFVAVKRSKVLPRGGALHQVDLGPIVRGLGEVLRFTRALGNAALTWDEAGGAYWDTIYPALSEPGTGLAGEVTSRAEAQVLRLSLLYALLDESEAIGRIHVEAAEALWRYCADSVRWIFGDSLGDPVADEILGELRRRHPAGMTRNALMDFFKRHRTAEAIGRALAILEERGLAVSRREATGGRPAERWCATRGSEESEESEESEAEADFSRNSAQSGAERESTPSARECEESPAASDFARFSRFPRSPGASTGRGPGEDEAVAEADAEPIRATVMGKVRL